MTKNFKMISVIAIILVMTLWENKKPIQICTCKDFYVFAYKYEYELYHLPNGLHSTIINSLKSKTFVKSIKILINSFVKCVLLLTLKIAT